MEGRKKLLTWLLISLYTTYVHAQGIVINAAGCRSKYTATGSNAQPKDATIQETILLWQGIVLLVCFGAFALFVSLLHRIVRTYVYYDAHLLDTFFDAGGDMSFGMIACAVAAKWAWTTAFTWSSDLTVKYGIVGHFWFAAGAGAHIFLFSIVAAEIRIKAPGAKTFLQVIYRRYGAPPHITLMIFAFLANIVISGMVMYEGTTLLSALSIDLKKEVVCVILAIVVGIYTVVGGIGGAIYVSLFSIALVLAILLTYHVDIFFNPWERTGNEFGNWSGLYDAMACGRADSDNEGSSLLTFLSKGAMVKGILIILSTFTTVFLDQGFWQIGVSGKPSHSVWGFITGGIIWFAVPMLAAFTFGSVFWAWSVQQGQYIVSERQVTFGFLPLVVSQRLLGNTGDFMMFTLIMAVTITTAASQVLASSSIVIYDIYQTYISPFRASSVTQENGLSIGTRRAMHNEEYLEYDRRCVVLKHVVVVCISCLLIPITLVLLEIDIDIPWLYQALGVVAGSCVVPIVLAITWHRITGSGVTSGVVGGFLAGVVAWLVYAATVYDGLNDFRVNTGNDISMLIGLSVSLGTSALICIIISLSCGGCDQERLEEEEWELTRAIDNPVLPWAIKYAPDIREVTRTKGVPHFYTVRRTFKNAEISAYIMGVFLAVLLVLIWPACMLLADVFTDTIFHGWWLGVFILGCLVTLFVVFVPLIVEIAQTCKQAYYNRAWVRRSGMQRLEESSVHTPSPSTNNVTVLRPQIHTMDAGSLKSGGSGLGDSTLGRDSLYSAQGRPDRWKTFIHLQD